MMRLLENEATRHSLRLRDIARSSLLPLLLHANDHTSYLSSLHAHDHLLTGRVLVSVDGVSERFLS